MGGMRWAEGGERKGGGRRGVGRWKGGRALRGRYSWVATDAGSSNSTRLGPGTTMQGLILVIYSVVSQSDPYDMSISACPWAGFRPAQRQGCIAMSLGCFVHGSSGCSSSGTAFCSA